MLPPSKPCCSRKKKPFPASFLCLDQPTPPPSPRVSDSLYPATHCNTLHHNATKLLQHSYITLQHCCNILHHAATHCNTLQRCCNVLHHAATLVQHTASVLSTWHTATHCTTLQHTATHCNTLQHTAPHCNTLQHNTTHCNTIQRTATLPWHTATATSTYEWVMSHTMSHVRYEWVMSHMNESCLI